MYSMKVFWILIVLTVCGLLIYQTHSINNLTPTNMKISSPSFQDNNKIPASFTCDGADINPELRFEGVPTDTVSLALIMDDPDAPNGLWRHWVLWNISPKSKSISEHSTPSGSVIGMNSGGQNGYAGPCPPSGTHHYHFRLYALDTKLDLPTTTNASELETAIDGHIIDQTEMVGLYTRMMEE